MADRRKYTGTSRLQSGWTLFCVVGFLAIISTEPPLDSLLLVAAFGGILLAGLIGLGIRERLLWNQMVGESAFEPEQGTRVADLERLYSNRSVIATTTVPSVFSQTHLDIETRVEHVTTDFTVELKYTGDDAGESGIQTGIEAIDRRFRIEGAKENVARLLSEEVQAGLLALETPGRCTISGERVVYTVPFTQLSGEELDTIADTVVVLANQVEAVAQGG